MMHEARKPAPNGDVLRTLHRLAHTDMTNDVAFGGAIEAFLRAFRHRMTARGLTEWNEDMQLAAFEAELRDDPGVDDLYAFVCGAVREFVAFGRRRQAELN